MDKGAEEMKIELTRTELKAIERIVNCSDDDLKIIGNLAGFPKTIKKIFNFNLFNKIKKKLK